MWTNAAAVSVSASATIDAAPGFDGYRYQTSGDGGAIWGALRSGSPATVKAEGVTLVRYEAVDLYGNASLWADGVVRIDRTAPTVPLAAGGNGSTSAPARPPTRSPRQVPRTPDRASPVTSTRRRPTAARPGRARRHGASYTAIDTVSHATVVVRFEALDAAGNTSAWSLPGPASTITLC